MKVYRIVSLLVLAAFFAYSLYTYQSSLTPYVTFAQAKSAKGVVQVKGNLTSSQIVRMEQVRAIAFAVRDDAGEEVMVTYKGVKPAGMEQASNVVVVGKYNEGQFIADRLLVKCPSKYQGSVK